MRHVSIVARIGIAGAGGAVDARVEVVVRPRPAIRDVRRILGRSAARPASRTRGNGTLAADRAVELALGAWRDALRRLADAPPGTPANVDAAMAAEDARRAYAGAAAQRYGAFKQVADLSSEDGDSPNAVRAGSSAEFASEHGRNAAEIARLSEELRTAGEERQQALDAAVAADAEAYDAVEWRAYDDAITVEAEAYEALRHAMDAGRGVI